MIVFGIILLLIAVMNPEHAAVLLTACASIR